MALTEQQLRSLIGIIVAVVMVSVAIFVSLRFFGGPAPEIGRDTVWLIDTETGESWAVTADEYRQMADQHAKSNSITPTVDPGQIRFKHLKTGRNTVAFAERCSKCGHVFMPNYMDSSDFFDRCPACGYSRYAEFRQE